LFVRKAGRDHAREREKEREGIGKDFEKFFVELIIFSCVGLGGIERFGLRIVAIRGDQNLEFYWSVIFH
jgi:hypothetical protein